MRYHEKLFTHVYKKLIIENLADTINCPLKSALITDARKIKSQWKTFVRRSYQGKRKRNIELYDKDITYATIFRINIYLNDKL